MESQPNFELVCRKKPPGHVMTSAGSEEVHRRQMTGEAAHSFGALGGAPNMLAFHNRKPSGLLSCLSVLTSWLLLYSPAHAAHPLITEDTGVQGKGNWQFELNTDRSKTVADDGSTRVRVVNSTLSYGVLDDWDIAVNFPHATISTNDTLAITRERGAGDIAIFAKWRFYEQGNLSLGLKPGVTIPTGDERKGLGNGRATFSLNALSALEAGNLSWLVTIGATVNRNSVDARTRLWNVSSAWKYQFNDQWSAGLDVGTYRSPEKQYRNDPEFALIGLIYSPTAAIDFDVGYKKGLNKAEVDYSLGAGMTLRW